MKKKMIILLTVIILTTIFVPVSCGATTTTTIYKEGYYTYTVTDGFATITDVSENISGDIEIPSMLGEHIVTSIGNSAFYHCGNITSIIIPDCVTSIGVYAFYHCSGITSIKIPDSVTSIEDSAFGYCSGLTSITIPDGVVNIGEFVFYHCSSLTSISIPDSVTSIEYAAFGFCSNLASIEIPYNVTIIEDYAFEGCISLENVYYTGSKEEWSNIVIGCDNESLTSATFIVCMYTPEEDSAEVEIFRASSIDTTLKIDSKVSISGNPEIVTFGTKFIPLSIREAGRGPTVGVAYSNSIYNIKDGQTFDATLRKIPSDCKDMDIVVVSYIVLSDNTYIWSPFKYASINDTTLKSIE